MGCRKRNGYGVCYENHILTFLVEVIPKTENPERLQSNLDVDSFTLSEEQIERLDSLEDGTHYCWNPEGVK